MRVCNRCRKETEQMFCPACHVLTYPPRAAGSAPTSAAGEFFDATIWQGPNRSRGIEIAQNERDKYFSKKQDLVVLHIEGRRTVATLGQQFWKKPAVIRKAVDDAGREQLVKFFEKHHLLPPAQSIKEKGIVDTVVFEVVVPCEEFKIAVTERAEGRGSEEES
ncbi:MAG: hypothetical protein A3K60_00355 [Euryarchaeota archaeon RBG_19FT_COMBO_56_21]|nr:MAG: hypothetical protein A3K60_00355 [Euryarchaeota archaeon RBG_19FT_COMBO_56_21]